MLNQTTNYSLLEPGNKALYLLKSTGYEKGKFVTCILKSMN